MKITQNPLNELGLISNVGVYLKKTREQSIVTNEGGKPKANEKCRKTRRI